MKIGDVYVEEDGNNPIEITGKAPGINGKASKFFIKDLTGDYWTGSIRVSEENIKGYGVRKEVYESLVFQAMGRIGESNSTGDDNG